MHTLLFGGLAAWLVQGCSSPSEDVDDTAMPSSPEPSAPAHATPWIRVGPGSLALDCSPDMRNRLRFHCEIGMEAPQGVVVEAWPADDTTGERVRRFVSPRQRDHAVLLWGFKPQTTYTWRVTADDGDARVGTLGTGTLPEEFSPQYTVVDSDDARVQGMLVYSTCAPGWTHIVDRDGDVVWYERLPDLLEDQKLFSLAGLERTPEGTILSVVGRMRVVEITMGGEVRLDLRRGVHFDDDVHHAVTRHEGITYALFAEVVDDGEFEYLVDGVYAFDGEQLLARASLADAWPLVGQPWTLSGYWASHYPGAFDFTHANGIAVRSSGELVVSLRHLHAVVGLRGNPGTPGFGTLAWSVVGNPASSIAPGDYAMPFGVAFAGQHDAQIVESDAGPVRLRMFDNRLDLKENARAVEFELNELARTATVHQSWSMATACPIQGTAREVEDGHILAVCSRSGDIWEFAPGRAEPVWQANGNCGPVPFSSIPRAVPWPLWEAPSLP